MTYYATGSPAQELSSGDLQSALFQALNALGDRRRVLAVPPDLTRVHSRAGDLTWMAWRYYGDRLTDILPATGTHYPMSDDEIMRMFGVVPRTLFREHDWRSGLSTLGSVPAGFVRTVSGGLVEYDIPVQVDQLIARGGHDLILSIGQVVPHEVVGMANHNKNILIGAGGGEGINKTHFLGAAYGMERIMGRADTPVRAVLDYGVGHFAAHLPVVYVLTVVGRKPGGGLAVRGLFIGDDAECFRRASELSLEVNFSMLDEPLRKVVVYLDPSEYRSLWLGNKSIYRTRMAIADGGELVVLAPGVREFGEDGGIDAMIRKYGYAGTPAILDAVERDDDLRSNLGAAAHMIHGSSEGRFTVTYCPGSLSRKEIEGVSLRYGDLAEMSGRYDRNRLKDGLNVLPDGEQIYFISNPGLGLWSTRARFAGDGKP